MECTHEELASVIARPISIIFERLWRTGEVPEDWRKVNVMPNFKNGKKEHTGNYRPVSISSIPGKVMDSTEEHFQEVVRGDPPPLLSSGEATPGELCPVLCYGNDKRTGAPVIQGRAERTGPV